jgi:hypothetical protein
MKQMGEIIADLFKKYFRPFAMDKARKHLEKEAGIISN